MSKEAVLAKIRSVLDDVDSSKEILVGREYQRERRGSSSSKSALWITR